MINSEFIERYQLELQRNPRSRVFAALAEAYRKLGLLDEARRICVRGTEYHPDFAGGHVAAAKVLIDLKEHAEALKHLEQAARLSPDNILAHSLMGETLLELRRPKEALKAFKMVLFLNPAEPKAQAAVRKWEFLTADEYEDPLFAMKPAIEPVPLEEVSKKIRLDKELESLLTENPLTKADELEFDRKQRHAKALDRALSLADAFTIRNDLDSAMDVIEEAARLLGRNAELTKRATLLAKRMQLLAEAGSDSDSDDEEIQEPPSMYLDLPPETELDRRLDPRVMSKRRKLERLLQRISQRRS